MDVRIKTLYYLRSWGISSHFPIKIFTHFAWKKDFLLDGQSFRLKIGAFSKITGRKPALRTAHDWKQIFMILFVLKKKIDKFYIISKLVANVY